MTLLLLQNFRRALKNEWKVPITKESDINVSFEGDTGVAVVEYPSNLKGWNVVPNRLPCKVS